MVQGSWRLELVMAVFSAELQPWGSFVRRVGGELATYGNHLGFR